jgi:hypothetical protein
MVSSLASMGIQLAINQLTAEPETAAQTSAEKEAMESAKR